jgi:hypothetical protein
MCLLQMKLLSLIDDFLNFRMTEIEFVERYQCGWKTMRDSGVMQQCNPKLSETLSTIFCLVDLYNPEDDRLEYEFDEVALRLKMGVAFQVFVDNNEWIFRE